MNQALSTSRRVTAVLLMMLVVVAALCRIPKLTRGLGQDELFTTVHFVEATPVYRTITSNLAFNNHIGYSVMARVSEMLFGRSEWALRLPALLLGLGTLPLLFFFTRDLLGLLPALLAALMLSISPAHIAWSEEARGYSGLIFFTLVSTTLYFRLLRRPDRREAVLYIAAGVLGIYIHLYAVFALLVQAAVLLQRGHSIQGGPCRRLLARCIATTAGISAFLYLPVIRGMAGDLAGRGHSAFNPAFPWTVLQELSGAEQTGVVALLVLVSVGGCWALLREQPQVARYLLAWLVLPLVIVCAARPFDLYPRFFAYWLPAFIVFFAAGVRGLWRLFPTGVAASLGRSAACVATGAAIVGWALLSQTRTPDEGYRDLTRAVMAGAGPDATFCAIGSARSVWQYYVPRPILIPKSLAEFKDFVQDRSDVRCFFYGDMAAHSTEQTKIADFLSQNAASVSRNGLTGFIYAPARGSVHAHAKAN